MSEFSNRDYFVGYPSTPPIDTYPYAYAIHRGTILFRSVYVKARLGLLWTHFRHMPKTLLSPAPLGNTTSMHSRGIEPVSISQIRGSEGRAAEFDHVFRPLYWHTRERWVHIASMIIMGVYLPAVELIKIDTIFFVRDGNHRVSVMRAMGAQFIDSRVTEVISISPEINEAQAIACASELEIS